MNYDFTTMMNRRGHDALAADAPEMAIGVPAGVCPGADPIPMWVADMNFPVFPGIQEAMAERIRHPAFGYFLPSEEYYQSILWWQKNSHGVTDLSREHIGYENGVLGGVISALNVFCSRGDSVLVHSPTYKGFTESLTGSGYHIVHSPLAIDENHVWRMDFEDMGEKIREGNIHAAILCSPHNPCGRVWERWELQQAMEIFERYDVKVISDEIWSDIVFDGHRHIPTQSVSLDARDRTVALYAPTKTFNLAGLVGSYHIIYDRTLRHRVEKEASLSRYNEMNVLSMHALTGAYTPEGRRWAEELCRTLSANAEFACRYIREHFDGVDVCRPEGTYMLFLDCTKWCIRHGRTIDELERAGYDAGVIWQDGRVFHGPCHIRMNLALPLERVKEAFLRLDKKVFCETER